MHSIKQEIRTTGAVSPEIPTSVFVISLHGAWGGVRKNQEKEKEILRAPGKVLMKAENQCCKKNYNRDFTAVFCAVNFELV